MTGTLIIVGVVLWFLLPIFICSAIAEQKGYPSGSAGCAGFLLGWFAVLFYALRSDKRKDAEDQAARLAMAMKSDQPASETAGLPSRSDEMATSDDITKRCPDCAENVKAAASVCRFCGHKFTPEESRESLEKSLGTALSRSSPARVRLIAVGMLPHQIGRRAIPYLLAALSDADWQVRISAANGLKTVGDPAVGQRLFDAMADSVRDARSWRVPFWEDAENAQNNRSFMRAVVNALVSFGERGTPYLVKSLESSSLRAEATHLLEGIGEPAADLLEKAIPRSEGRVRKRMERIVADIRHCSGYASQSWSHRMK